MSTNDAARPGCRSGTGQETGGEHVQATVTGPRVITPAQAWAAAWLDGPHTEPDCRTCSAGWGPLDIGPRTRGVNARGHAAGAIGDAQ